MTTSILRVVPRKNKPHYWLEKKEWWRSQFTSLAYWDGNGWASSEVVCGTVHAGLVLSNIRALVQYDQRG